MSDIFISYSSKDRPWVEPFAKALETHGWSVWWDRNIPTGGSFNAVIRQELAAAKCAIVVWSEESVESEWVQAEAAEAKKQDKYLPIKITECQIPLGFTQRTYQSLAEWEVGVEHAGFSQLLKDIERLVKSPAKQIVVGPKPWWKRVHPIWLVSAPAILAAVVVIGLMRSSIPARVQVELTTERVEFEVAASEQGKITLGGFDVQSVAIEKFSALTFEPDTFEVADPAQYQDKTDDFPPSAWKLLNVDPATITKVTLGARDQTRHPRVTVEGLNAAESETIHLDPIAVAPGTHVTMATREVHGGKKEGVTLQVTGQDTLTLSIHKPFKLIADQVKLRDIASPFGNQDELTYRIALPEQASWIAVTALSGGLILSPTFVSGQSTSFFSGIPVVTMDLTKQDSSGERISALIGQGTISFPDYPHLGTVPLNESEAVGLEQLDKFTIERVTVRPEGNGLNIVGHGLVKQVRTKRGEIPIQHSLTALDALWHNARLAVFVAIVSAVFTTSLGAYRLWKEFKR